MCSDVFGFQIISHFYELVEGSYYGRSFQIRIAVFLMSHKILTASSSSGFKCTRVFLPYPQETTLFSPHLDKKAGM